MLSHSAGSLPVLHWSYPESYLLAPDPIYHRDSPQLAQGVSPIIFSLLTVSDWLQAMTPCLNHSKASRVASMHSICTLYFISCESPFQKSPDASDR